MKTFRVLFMAAAVAACVAGQTASADHETLQKMRREAFENSAAAPVFEMLTGSIGPRLTASPAHKRAAEYVKERLASYGLENARLEPWSFGRGWSTEKLT